MSTQKIFHLMMGTDGGTERFFLRLSRAFHERGIAQEFAIRPNRDWQPELEPRGRIHQGHFLRRTPVGLWQAARLRRQIVESQADAVMAWRAPAARLIPKGGPAAKIVRLGDYPRHLRHFGQINAIVGIAPKVISCCRDLGWQGQSALISNFPPEVHLTAVPRQSLSTPDDVPLVCAVGRFSPSKGFDTLIRAIARTDDLWLWLVGDGEQRAELEALVAELGIQSRVRMPGWVPNAGDYMASGDVFCVPSRVEPLGNVLLEGWSSGRPMVMTRAEGPDWAATHRCDALVVEIDHVEDLAAALSEVVHSSELAASLVAGGQQVLAERFSKDVVVTAYLALFEQLRNAPA